MQILIGIFLLVGAALLVFVACTKSPVQKSDHYEMRRFENVFDWILLGSGLTLFGLALLELFVR